MVEPNKALKAHCFPHKESFGWRSIEILMGNKCSNDEAAAAGSYLAASDKEKEGKCFPSQFSFSACLQLRETV